MHRFLSPIRAVVICASMAFITTAAVADIIDDNVVKAQQGLERAQKRLAAAKECQVNREACLKDMKEKATAAVARAQKKLAAISN